MRLEAKRGSEHPEVPEQTATARNTALRTELFEKRTLEPPVSIVAATFRASAERTPLRTPREAERPTLLSPTLLQQPVRGPREDAGEGARMVVVPRLIAISLAAAMVLGPVAARAVDTIPFTDGPGGAIAVQASVDGRAPLPMLVDLGAGLDLLSSSAGRSLLNVKGKYATLRLTTQRADIPYGSVLSLAIGAVRLNAPVVGIWSGLDGTGIDGLISASAFATIATTFDYRAHQLIVEDATTFPPRKLGATRVGLVVRDDEGIATDVFARFEVDGKSYLCQVVTGSQPITFDTSLAPALGVNVNNPSLARVHTQWGDGVAATISSLMLTGASQTALPHPQVVFANLIHDCYVGNAFWSKRGFTLDLLGRVMYIPPG